MADPSAVPANGLRHIVMPYAPFTVFGAWPLRWHREREKSMGYADFFARFARDYEYTHCASAAITAHCTLQTQFVPVIGIRLLLSTMQP